MKRFLTTLLAALPLAGCGVFFPVVASAELTSLMRFGAYPGATLVSESVAQGNLGALGVRSNHAYVSYQTTDTPEQIRAHYAGLAATHGWTFAAVAEPPVDTRHDGPLVQLTHEQFTLDVWVFPDHTATSEAPSPHPGPWDIRVGASVDGN